MNIYSLGIATYTTIWIPFDPKMALIKLFPILDHVKNHVTLHSHMIYKSGVRIIDFVR